jgi:O-antigen/teichoic acid export membrane protein
MLSVLAKLGSTSVVGQFALALSISAPVFMFTNLQLRAVQATDARSEYPFGDYFTLRILATGTGFLAVALLVALVKYDRSTGVVILLVSVAKSVECVGDVAAGLLQKNERLHRVAISLMIRGLLSVVVFGLLFSKFRSLAWAVAGMTGTWLMVIALFDLRWAASLIAPGEGFFRFRVSDLKRLLILSLPLGFVISLASLNVNIPRYFLQHYVGSAELGVFASLAYLVIAANLIVNALGQSVTTRLSRLFADGAVDHFKSVMWKLVLVGMAIAGLGVALSFLVGRPVLTLLYRREYADYIHLLALLAGVAGVNAIGAFIIFGVSAARSFRSQVPVNGIAVLAGIAGCTVLIPHYGLMGAALALLLSALVAALGAAWILRSALRSVPAQINTY